MQNGFINESINEMAIFPTVCINTSLVFYSFLRAVAYRWLIRWICGYLGWDNSRPLPACVYKHIRVKYPSHQSRGYQTAQQRD